MLTAMLAVENIFGAKNDLWSVNVERSYHEEFEVAADKKEASQAAATAESVEAVLASEQAARVIAA